MTKKAAIVALKANRAQIAGVLGVSRDHVTRLTAEGMPCLRSGSGRGNRSEYDVAAVIAWWRARLEAQYDPRPAASADVQERIDVARAQKLEAEARIAEAEADQVEEILVVAADVTDRLAAVAIAVREAVLTIPAQAVQSGAIRPDQEAAVEELCRQALRDITKLEPEPENEDTPAEELDS